MFGCCFALHQMLLKTNWLMLTARHPAQRKGARGSVGTGGAQLLACSPASPPKRFANLNRAADASSEHPLACLLLLLLLIT
jgi:hypothetical protein